MINVCFRYFIYFEGSIITSYVPAGDVYPWLYKLLAAAWLFTKTKREIAPVRVAAFLSIPKSILAMNIEALYNQHYLELYKYAFYKSRNADQAKDYVHSAFYKLLHVDQTLDNPLGYIKTIIRNEIIQSYEHVEMRKKNEDRIIYHFEHVLIDTTDDNYEKVKYKAATVRKHIKRIKASQKRRCMQLHFIQQMPLLKVAEAMGVSRNTVKTYIRNGIQEIKSSMQYHKF